MTDCRSVVPVSHTHFLCSGDPLAIAAAQAAHEAKKRKWKQLGPDGKPVLSVVKQRKKVDRFDGIPEDEVTKKTLPDHLGPNLDIVIVSIMEQDQALPLRFSPQPSNKLILASLWLSCLRLLVIHEI